MRRKIEELFDSQVRPALANHGGDIELIDVEDNKVYVRLTGGCQGCAGARATLKAGVERIIREAYPEITEVIDMTSHNKGQNPFM
ncbi:MAG: hypothetical protein A2504_11990 [Bdellovibrionales bacterium RIFOXYD12_FULL_39_22]|nr:MAG: hypothetical protein A2385_16505 [Bdellovibrionales bacterium RIFOXYB1_FULL_39_21]OFZ44442.1 MAG: hypothetical protein A2485_06390 [Bdellovibrionales bacterium RIFOXYC12_FULL_39_17]OFZ49916.1 MAG: hypothetical protein A2404_01075 [Bdellovibrionales bacterium RIFOXYC1_FULL_39_130]OFZ76921.1 MAG: hypothetical protein A2560_05875 [Bdellovibrionales bacterium RIFOXYD1_FULL_39_84]OFZ95848.1 MAG: hypothetical protein A2504_11990 [Bdellovibrionales bacterium RIFOXYD12_FULL_39_22]HLE10869.1 Ni